MQIIQVCGDYKYPPFEFINDEGEYTGFNIDITKSIADEMGFEVSFNLMNWTKAIECMKNGSCQALQGMSISSSRKKEFSFSKEYLTVFHSVFALKERNDISSLDDLYSQKIAVQDNDISFDIITKMANSSKPIHLVVVPNQEIALEKLFLKEVDAIAGNMLTITYFAKAEGKSSLIKSIGDPINITKFGIGVKKNRRDILYLFNEGIKRIKKKGIYKEIYDKWFGQQVDYMDNQIIENVGTGLVCINNLGNITAINNAASIILDINREDNLFKSFYESDLVKIIDTYIIQEVLYEGGNAFFKEITYKVDNVEKILNLNVSPLIDYDNNVTGVIINLRDVTREKKIEKALITKDKMESLGRLMLNVAHEIRNPLTSIKNFIEIMPEHIDDPEYRESLLNHVPKQIDVIDLILKDLLEYSSPKTPTVSSVNLNSFVKSIVNVISSQKTINFLIDIPEDIDINTDTKQLRQILYNLILNSIDSMDQYGSIEISASKSNGRIKIVIADDGHGIEKEDLIKIFDPFFTTKDNGTGLGLFITYNLVKENNGDIEIKSDEEGTKVALFFPE